jgi:hypothetical protein
MATTHAKPQPRCMIEKKCSDSHSDSENLSRKKPCLSDFTWTIRHHLSQKMVKNDKHGGGKPSHGSERGGIPRGGGTFHGGIDKNKKKAFKGLAFLDRGKTDYRSDKGQELKKQLFAEAKRKAAYAKLLQKEGYKPLEFPSDNDDDEDRMNTVPAQGKKDGSSKAAHQNKAGKDHPGANRSMPAGSKGKRKENEHVSSSEGDSDDDDDDDMEGASSSDDQFMDESVDDSDKECEISDEEIDDGAIVFKDTKLQSVWSGQKPKVDPSKAAQNKNHKISKKGIIAPGKSLFQVPQWGESGSDDDKEADDHKGKAPTPAAQKNKARPDQKSDKQSDADKGKKHMDHKPNPFAKVAQEADKKKQAEELERKRLIEEAEKAKAARDAYFKGRKKDRAMHMKKTAKGQPVLKNMINGMLAKLQKDA